MPNPINPPPATTGTTKFVREDGVLAVPGGAAVPVVQSSQYNAVAPFALTDGTTIALDWNNGNVQKVTLGGNRTFTFANPVAGARYVLFITQDGSGSRTLSFPTVKWGNGTTPVLTTTANKTDIITLIYDGTSYFGLFNVNF